MLGLFLVLRGESKRHCQRSKQRDCGKAHQESGFHVASPQSFSKLVSWPGCEARHVEPIPWPRSRRRQGANGCFVRCWNRGRRVRALAVGIGIAVVSAGDQHEGMSAKIHVLRSTAGWNTDARDCSVIIYL